MTPREALGVRRTLWQFAQGHMTASEFEPWLYANIEDANLVSVVGDDLLLDLLWARYGGNGQVWGIRDALRRQLVATQSSTCRCERWRDREVVDWIEMENLVGNSTIRLRRNPWIDYVRCNRCDQAWYVGADVENVQCQLLRLDEASVDEIRTGIWPTDFDHIAALWPSK
jgi:hypothetical protein